MVILVPGGVLFDMWNIFKIAWPKFVLLKIGYINIIIIWNNLFRCGTLIIYMIILVLLFGKVQKFL